MRKQSILQNLKFRKKNATTGGSTSRVAEKVLSNQTPNNYKRWINYFFKTTRNQNFLKALENYQMQADTKGSLHLEEANEGFLIYTLYLLAWRQVHKPPSVRCWATKT